MRIKSCTLFLYPLPNHFFVILVKDLGTDSHHIITFTPSPL